MSPSPVDDTFSLDCFSPPHAPSSRIAESQVSGFTRETNKLEAVSWTFTYGFFESQLFCDFWLSIAM